MTFIIVFLVAAVAFAIDFGVVLEAIRKKASVISKIIAPIIGLLVYGVVCVLGGLLIHRADIAESAYLEFDAAEGASIGIRMVLPVSLAIGVICIIINKKFNILGKLSSADEKEDAGEK